MIRSKSEMYEKLHKGEFGNTVPMWFNCVKWQESPEYHIYQWWGVRCLTPGGPCFLNVTRKDVARFCNVITVAEYDYNISPMIDRVVNVTLWANIWDSPSGLVVEGIMNPPQTASWRDLMPDPNHYIRWERSAAVALLLNHLNPNSLDDLYILLDKYPEHVVELSATEQQFGTVPGRNAVIWEVRNY